MTKKKFLPGSVLVLSGGHFFHDLYSNFLAPVLPLIIASLGISYSQAGLLSVFHRLPSVLNPLIGTIASKKNPAVIISISIVVSSTVMCFITSAPTYTVLALLILIMGISSCFFHIPSPVLIRKFSGDMTGTGMSFYMLGGELARSAGPIVVLTAVSLWGKEKVYYLLPGAVIYALIILTMFYKNRDENTESVKPEEKGFLNVLKDMKIFFFAITMILIARTSIASVLNTYLPAYLTSKGLSLWFSGISLSILQLSAAAGVMFSGFISDKIGKTRILLISTALSPVLMLLFSVSNGYLSIFLLVLTGFAAFSSSPVLLAYVQEQSGDNPVVCSSIFMTADFLTITAAITAAGFLGDSFGLQTAFIISGFVSLIGFPFVFLLKRKSAAEIR